ncbi:unnamed protein product [Schistosoma mattheei]|uniref:Uncharacterized protein n=1 Tax=Schistosoma mattheei TaxID=31246 RepID=A0A183P2C6_9TREM|nr:unnamed protein product [Schistosoma mattheei]
MLKSPPEDIRDTLRLKMEAGLLKASSILSAIIRAIQVIVISCCIQAYVQQSSLFRQWPSKPTSNPPHSPFAKPKKALLGEIQATW